ncbi:TPA: hypothetical protein QDA91_001893 [Burkholderia vietnamiensis]|nr:hypothetical protein [Burkholderia vietnamiensis]
MTKYNGHKNWNHWNVSLWINNDEGLYRMARFWVSRNRRNGGKQKAARDMLDELHGMSNTHTPDGAPYSVSSIRAAMVGM